MTSTEKISDDRPAAAGPRGRSSPGMRELDVGTGSGSNVAIPAAQRGAEVVGVDLTDAWFDAARRRAAAAGVEVEWVVGDAEALPFEDAQLRPRALDLRAHVRARPPPGGAGATARPQAGRRGGLHHLAHAWPVRPALPRRRRTRAAAARRRRRAAPVGRPRARPRHARDRPSPSSARTRSSTPRGRPTSSRSSSSTTSARWSPCGRCSRRTRAEALDADLRATYAGVNEATDGTPATPGAAYVITVAKPARAHGGPVTCG